MSLFHANESINRESGRPAETRDRTVVICVVLVLLVAAVFGQTGCYDFINCDDPLCVYQNPHVTRGLAIGEIGWVFTHRYADNYVPLTWISHMADWQLYGDSAGGHHLTNVLLHAAAAVLLFLALRRLTGRQWPSAFAAALFAVHPLRVESVAWVTERKDVLCGLFFMLALWAYAGYASRRFSIIRYMSVLFAFALALLAKPMAATLPGVLLLLDYWPLCRFTRTSAETGETGRPQWLRCVLEKIPLMILAAASTAATIWAQERALTADVPVSQGQRIAAAAVSYVDYLTRFFHPTDLAFFGATPSGDSAPTANAVAAVFFLLTITVGVFLLRRKLPYLLVGWLWFLGMSLPVIGLLPFGYGVQGAADRFTYLPQIGLGIALAWSMADLLAAWSSPQRSRTGGALAALTVIMLAFIAFCQTAYWRDAETLWRHTIDVVPQNHLAHNNLGSVLDSRGRCEEAIYEYQQALKINPDYAQALHNLGTAYIHLGQPAAAIENYRKALSLQPELVEARHNLGMILMALPDHNGEAVKCFEEVLRIDPQLHGTEYFLARALVADDRPGEAITHLERALTISPDYTDAQTALAWLLAACPQASLRDGGKAVKLALKANSLLQGGNPDVLMALAAAYAETGRFAKARSTAEEALDLAAKYHITSMIHALETQIESYKNGKPLREDGIPFPFSHNRTRSDKPPNSQGT